jgi:hypothetical protein
MGILSMEEPTKIFHPKKFEKAKKNSTIGAVY